MILLPDSENPSESRKRFFLRYGCWDWTEHTLDRSRGQECPAEGFERVVLSEEASHSQLQITPVTRRESICM